MKYLLLLLLTVPVFAADLEFTNLTNDRVRLARLSNKCKGELLEKPVYLNPNEKFIFKNTVPVVHTYEVCGYGLCSNSAFGLKDSRKYKLNIVLDGTSLITIKSYPDHWVGNIECPK